MSTAAEMIPETAVVAAGTPETAIKAIAETAATSTLEAPLCSPSGAATTSPLGGSVSCAWARTPKAPVEGLVSPASDSATIPVLERPCTRAVDLKTPTLSDQSISLAFSQTATARRETPVSSALDLETDGLEELTRPSFDATGILPPRGPVSLSLDPEATVPSGESPASDAATTDSSDAMLSPSSDSTITIPQDELVSRAGDSEQTHFPEKPSSPVSGPSRSPEGVHFPGFDSAATSPFEEPLYPVLDLTATDSLEGSYFLDFDSTTASPAEEPSSPVLNAGDFPWAIFDSTAAAGWGTRAPLTGFRGQLDASVSEPASAFQPLPPNPPRLLSLSYIPGRPLTPIPELDEEAGDDQVQTSASSWSSDTSDSCSVSFTPISIPDLSPVPAALLPTFPTTPPSAVPATTAITTAIGNPMSLSFSSPSPLSRQRLPVLPASGPAPAEPGSEPEPKPAPSVPSPPMTTSQPVWKRTRSSIVSGLRKCRGKVKAVVAGSAGGGGSVQERGPSQQGGRR